MATVKVGPETRVLMLAQGEKASEFGDLQGADGKRYSVDSFDGYDARLG
jgi:hypothetical protein